MTANGTSNVSLKVSAPTERKLCGQLLPGIGLGCMNVSHAYGKPPPPELARETLDKALDLGIVHFDTAALYGFGRNEELLGKCLKHQSPR